MDADGTSIKPVFSESDVWFNVESFISIMKEHLLLNPNLSILREKVSIYDSICVELRDWLNLLHIFLG